MLNAFASYRSSACSAKTTSRDRRPENLGTIADRALFTSKFYKCNTVSSLHFAAFPAYIPSPSFLPRFSAFFYPLGVVVGFILPTKKNTKSHSTPLFALNAPRISALLFAESSSKARKSILTLPRARPFRAISNTCLCFVTTTTILPSPSFALPLFNLPFHTSSFAVLGSLPPCPRVSVSVSTTRKTSKPLRDPATTTFSVFSLLLYCPCLLLSLSLTTGSVLRRVASSPHTNLTEAPFTATFLHLVSASVCSLHQPGIDPHPSLCPSPPPPLSYSSTSAFATRILSPIAPPGSLGKSPSRSRFYSLSHQPLTIHISHILDNAFPSENPEAFLRPKH